MRHGSLRKLARLSSAHLAAGLLLLACAASAMQWGRRLLPPSGGAPLAARGPISLSFDDIAQGAREMYGAQPVKAAPPPKYRLWGVIGGGPGAGAALIGIDDAPAKVFGIDAEIAPGVRLVGTGFGEAVLQEGGARTTLHTPDARERASLRREDEAAQRPELRRRSSFGSDDDMRYQLGRDDDLSDIR